MIGSQNNDPGQMTSIDSNTNCSMNFYKCKSFLCKLGMRFTKMGCNNATKCIIPLWIVGWNNVGKIQPAINVAAGVAHLAQSSSGQPRTEERWGASHNISINTELRPASLVNIKTERNTKNSIHRKLKSVYYNQYNPTNCQYSLLLWFKGRNGVLLR